MTFLNIFSNPTLHIIAEFLAIVIGSMLLGILLSYLHWGEFKKKAIKLGKNLDLERDQALQLKEKISDLEAIAAYVQNELNTEKARQQHQSKTIFEQQQKNYEQEKSIRELKIQIDALRNELDTSAKRIAVISRELIKGEHTGEQPRPIPLVTTRANYEYVSDLLGKQVTENDLTVITGIGPKTALILHGQGIHTWHQLADASVEVLQGMLREAGGPFKSVDPTHWPKQARMAALGEWRKLRIFQQSVKGQEG